MIDIIYKSTFVKQFDSLEEALQSEVLEKIKHFKDRKNHKQLKVHKLHGHMSQQWSFSVNYKFRIVFYNISKNEVVFLAIGSHDVYK